MGKISYIELAIDVLFCAGCLAIGIGVWLTFDIGTTLIVNGALLVLLCLVLQKSLLSSENDTETPIKE